MATISDLITKTNIYTTQGQRTYLNPEVVKEVARWITQLVNIFGLDSAVPSTRIGWSTVNTNESTDSNQVVLPYLRVLSNFRQEVRKIAMTQQSPMKKELLDLCDKVRDQDLTNLGVYLDDRDSSQLPLVKFIPRGELIKAREERNAELASREKRKEEANLERERANQARAEKGKQSHLDMFKTEEYNAWDGEGLPTKDAQGEEITKSRSKKLRKDWERQKKLHEAWVSADGTS
jgi:cysteinyl-tRNA synthetase